MELDTVFKLSRELKEAWELFGRQKDIYPHLIKNAVDFKLDRKTYSDRVSANGGCFTKPMRCFSAFITQRMLIEFLLSDKVDDKLVYYYEAYLKEIAQQLTATQMRNIEYSLSYNRIKRKII
jgi:hypothetical protein